MPLKVLIVEDDPPTLELMTEVFRSLRAEVRALSDSQQAALLVEQEKFDGIFLDLLMPHLNGFQLAQRIRTSACNRSTPIVILTGYEDRDTMQKAFSMGATFFLRKPADRNLLIKLFKSTSGTIFENKRRVIRVPVRTPVICETGGKSFKGTSVNIGESGILIEIGNFAEINSTLEVSFKLPEQKPFVRVPGKLIRIQAQRLHAIQFQGLEQNERNSMHDFINAYLR